MKQNKFKLTAIFSVLLLTMVLGLCGCGNNSSEVSDARRSMESGQAKKIRDKFADDSVTEIVVDEDVTVMGCLVVNGKKTISGTGTITLDPRAKAGIYQDAAALEDGKTLTEEDLAQMLESSLLYVNKGAELNLAGEVVIDSNMSGNGVVVAEGGSVVISDKASLLNGNFCSLYNQGEVSLEGGTLSGANGYIIINDGTLTVKKGEMDASKAMGNIYNLDSLTVSGGILGKATVNNVYVAEGTAVFNGGSVTGAKKANIYVAEAGIAEVQKNAMIQAGTTGIVNHGSLKLKEAKLERNLSQIQNFGTAEINKSELLTASVDHIVNEKTGTLNIVNSNLTSAGARAIANNKGKVTFKNLGVRRTGGNAICNNGGTIEGEEIVIYGASGTAIDNIDAVDALGGNVKIKGIEIQTGNGMNICQQSGGKMELTDVISGITSVTNIKVVSGELVINGLEVQGTTSTGAGIWTIGGKLEVNDALIKSTKGRGMALSGGEVTGKNIKLEDIINTGIDVMRHNNKYSSAKAVLDNVSFSGCDRDNIATTGEQADITINGGSFGPTLGNNVRIREGVCTLNKVDVLGNELGEDGVKKDYHCIYQAGGGVLTMNDCTLRNPFACAIRQKGGTIIAKNLKTYNTPLAAITNAEYEDGTPGKITIDGLVTHNAKLGVLRTDNPSCNITVTNGVLNESPANIVYAKEGKIVLKDTVVHRAIKGTNAKGEPVSYHNTFTTNGTLEMKNVVLQDSDASGIRQAGGLVIGDNVTIKNAKTNNVYITNGKTILKNSTLEVSKRTNVNLNIDTKIKDAKAEIVLTNTKVNGAGNLTGDNVGCIYLGYNTTATLDGGTVVRDSATSHGVTIERGALYGKDATITGNGALGINNKAGTLHLDGTTVTKNKTRGINVAKFDTKDKDGKAITYYATTPAVIKNAVISDNGNGSVSGGAIYCEEGALTVANSTLSGNKAHTGGAINCGNRSNVTLKNVTIKNNKAIVYGTNAGNGGGIHVSGTSQCNIYGGNITGNTAAGKANGIRVNDDFGMYDGAVVDPNNDIYLELGKVIATNTNGIGNTAANPLPVTSSSTTTGTIIITANNVAEAKRASGVIKVTDSDGNVAETSGFEENVVIGKEGAVAWVARTQNKDGSYTKYLTLQEAIDAVPKDGVLTRVEVLNDITLSAAVDIAENGNRNILLTDDGNGPYTITRGFTGGTMIILRTGNDMVLEGSSKDDTAPSLIFDGAGLAAGNDQAILKVGTNSTKNYHASLIMNAGVRMTNNKSTSAGAAMRIYGTLTMNGGVIDQNECTAEAGGISIYDNATFTMNGGTISNNKATKAGGAICNISSTGVGGAATITMNGGVIANNTTGDQAGAIFMHANGKFIMNDGVIDGNTATKNGGAVYLHQNASLGVPASMEMNGGIISNNKANGTDGGGAVFATAGASITMNDGTIKGNTAAAGSAILVGPSKTNSVATFTMKGGLVSANNATAASTGGAIFVHANAEFNFIDGEIKDNTANGNGGAVYIHSNTSTYADGKHGGDGYVKMTGGTMSGNIANGGNGGGAILVVGEFVMEDGLIDGNSTAQGKGNGGAVRVNTGGKMTMKAGTISNNVSGGTAGGGAIYIAAGGELDMQDGTLTKNSAPAGGAILTYGNVTMKAGTISENTTTANGGAVFVHYKALFDMQGGEIKDNTSGGNGGAVYLHYNAENGVGTMKMSGGTITGNTAKNGGGVGMANAANTLTMTGGSITGNTAAENGNDIYVAGALNMAGESVADSIYLEAGKTVNLTAALSNRQTITEIVLPAYQAGTKVISGDAAIVAVGYAKFDVPDGKGVDIDSTGCLVSNGEVVASVARIKQANNSYITYPTLAEAINAVPKDGTETTVEITDNITLTEAVSISDGRNVVLTDDGTARTITRGFQNGRMFVVSADTTLKFVGSGKDDANPTLVLDGAGLAAGTEQQIIAVGTSASDNTAVVTIEAGVKLYNNNASDDGGAVVVYGVLNMNGGLITGNTSGNYGGGVCIQSGASLVMTGGEISGNTATSRNADVYHTGKTLSMEGTAYIQKVYLNGKAIKFTGKLSDRAKVTTISFRLLEEEDEILTGKNISSNYKYFQLADDSYYIDEEGLLWEN